LSDEGITISPHGFHMSSCFSRNSVLSDIEADLISDYTAALQLEPQWTNHGKVTY